MWIVHFASDYQVSRLCRVFDMTKERWLAKMMITAQSHQDLIRNREITARRNADALMLREFGKTK